MGFPPPPHRRESPLDVSAESTFDRWLALAPDDTRTIEEFAADPGYFTHTVETFPFRVHRSLEGPRQSSRHGPESAHIAHRSTQDI